MIKKYFSPIAVAVAIVGTAYFIWPYIQLASALSSTGPYPMNWSINRPTDDTSFGGIFAMPKFSDSLPHYQYQLKLDSFKRWQNEIETNNKGFSEEGRSGKHFGVRSVRKSWSDFFSGSELDKPECKAINILLDSLVKKKYSTGNKDSINYFKVAIDSLHWFYNVCINKKEVEGTLDTAHYYYLELNNYDLDYDTKFYTKNDGTYHLAYVKWDSLINRKFDSTKVGHYISKQIPIRYSTEQKKLLIPITRDRFKTINTYLSISTFVFIFLTIYLFLGIPIQILINISKGKAFIESNVKKFRIMAVALFLYYLYSILMPLFLQVYYRKVIPVDFQPQSLFRIIIENSFALSISVALFIIAAAFKRGCRLQQEQDLTI